MEVLTATVETLLPSTCPGCDGELPGFARGLCPACWSTLTPFPGPRCPRCGGETDCAGAACLACATAPPPQAGTVILGEHAGRLRVAVLALKHHGRDELASPLAARLADRVATAAWARDLDLVMAVPSHPLHRLRRGWTAAELVARGVARRLALPHRCGLRRHGIRRQAGRGRAARRRLPRRAFTAGELPTGTRVLLVDDVTTTGMTLRRASEALLAAGAAVVYCAAVAAAVDPRRLA